MAGSVNEVRLEKLKRQRRARTFPDGQARSGYALNIISLDDQITLLEGKIQHGKSSE